MICSLNTQQERQIFDSYGRRYTSKVCIHCGKTGHVIDTCYRKHSFPPQFKFKNHKADYNNNEYNHEDSRSKIHS